MFTILLIPIYIVSDSMEKDMNSLINSLETLLLLSSPGYIKPDEYFRLWNWSADHLLYKPGQDLKAIHRMMQEITPSLLKNL